MAVWLVVVTAVVGNVVVLVVLINRSFKLTTPKFLMCNLAFADLCMGVYLLIIASMDVHTIGVYFSYAIDWQEGERMSADVSGCQRISTDVSWCQRMSADVSRCQRMSVDVSRCQRVSADISLCQLMSAGVSGCQRVSASVSGCQLMLADVSGCQLVSADVS